VGVRRARLRPEFAEWYPRIPVGEWHNAMWMAEAVRRQLLQGTPTWIAGRRVLDGRHFDFESGDYRPYTGIDRRMPDPHAEPKT
jgi:hypothetical protein